MITHTDGFDPGTLVLDIYHSNILVYIGVNLKIFPAHPVNEVHVIMYIVMHCNNVVVNVDTAEDVSKTQLCTCT